MRASFGTFTVLSLAIMHFNASKLLFVPIAISILLNLGRLIYAKKSLSINFERRIYLRNIMLMTLASGINMGVIYGSIAYFHDTRLVPISLLILAGTVAGTTNMYFPFPKLGLTFLGCTLAPVSIVLIASLDFEFILMGVLTALYAYPMSMIILQNSKFLDESLTSNLKLAESENLLQKTLEHMPGPVYAKDINGKIIFQNSKFPNNVPELENVEIIDEPLHYEHQQEYESGHKFYDIYKFPLFENGIRYGMACVSIDITERKTAQLELESQKKITAHQSKLAMIGELAAGVGHEINNPLSIVVAKTNLVVERLIGPAEIDNRQELGKVLAAAERIKKIVLGLKTFSRKDSDEFQVINLSQLVKDSVELVSKIYENEGVSVKTFTKDHDIYIKGNFVQLQQVMINFLSNAKDATFGRNPRKIDIHVGMLKDKPFFSVTDNGVGVSEEIKERIFQPFFTTKPVKEGTGLGLAIVRNIARDHQCEILIENNSEGGACFKFIFSECTRSVLPEETTARSDSRLENLSDSFSCLVVEDDEDVREILVEYLSYSHNYVVGVKEGSEALSRLNNEKFDFIITDMRMPNMTGLELANKVKERRDLVPPSIILVTGGTVEHIDLKKHTSIDAILYKPFTKEELLSVIQSNRYKRVA